MNYELISLLTAAALLCVMLAVMVWKNVRSARLPARPAPWTHGEMRTWVGWGVFGDVTIMIKVTTNADAPPNIPGVEWMEW